MYVGTCLEAISRFFIFGDGSNDKQEKDPPNQIDVYRN